MNECQHKRCNEERLLFSQYCPQHREDGALEPLSSGELASEHETLAKASPRGTQDKQPSTITRFEVIDWTANAKLGRGFIKWEDFTFNVQFDIQDGGKTLKVFLCDEPRSELWSFSELAQELQTQGGRD